MLCHLICEKHIHTTKPLSNFSDQGYEPAVR